MRKLSIIGVKLLTQSHTNNKWELGIQIYRVIPQV